MKEIVPTIGRRVWYWPGQRDLTRVVDSTSPLVMAAFDPAQPFDAGIVFVHSNSLVNLVVTDHDGRVHRRLNILLLQPGQLPPPTGTTPYCTWMPYQVEKEKEKTT